MPGYKTSAEFKQGYVDALKTFDDELVTAKKNVDDLTKAATTTGGGGGKTTPETTTTGGGGGKTTTPATTTGGGGGKTTTPAGGTGTTGTANLPSQTGGPPQQPKKIFNDNNDRKIKFVDRTKVIYRDNDDTNIDKQYIISSNKNTCPTQSETVALNGKINPKGIRILADFDPCRISDGSVTLNMPNTGSIKLALLFIDNVGNNDAGVLVKPVKIQDLSTNQALFSVELDGNMNGINPLSGQSTSISRINGLAVYNDGDQPVQFNSGNIAALTATFTK